MSQWRDKRERMPQSEAARRSERARREIRVFGDPVLKETAYPVGDYDGQLRKLAFHMIDVMEDAPGVGLAAPQVGVLKRLIIFVDEDDEPRALVNPMVVTRSDVSEKADEGCLSVPGAIVPVERAKEISVQAYDLHGAALSFTVHDLQARIIQHEVDHLDGVLILDRTGRRERAAALREMRDAEGAA